MIPRAVAMVALAPLVAALYGLFGFLTPKIILAVLVSLGLGIVSYTGMQAGVSALESQLASQFAAMSADLVDIVALTRIDDAVSVVVSAYVFRVTFASITKPWKFVFMGHGS